MRTLQAYLSACLALLLAAAGAGPAQAAEYCVASNAELRNALYQAEVSPEADVIKLVRGNYPLSLALSAAPIRGDLVLRGGYPPGCPIVGRSIDPALTRIHAEPRQEFHVALQPQANLEIDGISFEDFLGVQINDPGTSSSVTGRIHVRRSRFSGNAFGLDVITDHHDVRIENNLFVGNASICCGGSSINFGVAVRHPRAATPAVAVDVLFNTVIGNPAGLRIVGGGPFSSAPRVQNNILRNSVELNDSLQIDAASVAATNNIIGTVHLINGGSFASNLLNVQADPMLDAEYVPEPGSPALHSATTFVLGGVPSTDNTGRARHIGSLPDRGAMESPVSDIGVITVTSTADSGPGTLRQALVDSNQTVNAEVIRFNLGSAAGCPYVIQLASALPQVTSPLTIDGWSQPGSSPNTQSLTDDARRCVVLEGNVSSGLRLRPPVDRSIVVKGLVFHAFTSAAIDVNGDGQAFILGNGFGLGSSYPGAALPGDAIVVSDAGGTRIGGDDEAQRNLIGRAAGAGVLLREGSGREVLRNFIGVQANGYGNAGNRVGVLVEGGHDDLIERNIIGHSTQQGIRVDAGAAPAGGVVINLNNVGRSLVRNPGAGNDYNIGNQRNGIRITSGSSHRLSSNSVAYNGTDGIVVLGDVQAQISANRVFGNAQLGIDLSPDGVDPQDSDLIGNGRGNGGQNYPVLQTAGGRNDEGVVTGYLPSRTGTFTIQVFASRECDPSGFGEGEALIAAEPVSITATIPLPGGPPGSTLPTNSSVAFSIPVNTVYANFGLHGSFITATATRHPDGNTSEFSACIPYEAGPELFRDGFED